jgi:signal-transduction protein with cAMP-binding, CBS, and nucleotidyltransferase domain
MVLETIRETGNAMVRLPAWRRSRRDWALAQRPWGWTINA